MKHILLLATAAASLALAGCKKEAEAPVDTAATSASADLSSPAAVASNSPAQAFINVAAASDAFEIEASKLAATQGKSPKIKSFATMMIKAHTGSTAKLQAASAAASPALTPVPALSAAQQATLDGLATKSGADFDSAFAQAQVSAHQGTLDALNGYAAGGDDASLKAFAVKMIPVVTAHLNLAKGL